MPPPLTHWVEIGVLGEAGIDPYNKLIDRNPDDDVKKVARK